MTEHCKQRHHVRNGIRWLRWTDTATERRGDKRIDMATVDIMPVGLGLGSNVGDRLDHLRQARSRVLALVGLMDGDCRCAPLYETDPVDCPPGSGPFLNTVMEFDVADSFDPRELLAGLREIERALGRPTRYPRNTPRPVDLDILYAGGIRLDTPLLTLPHPRLSRRRFVLEPLAAIRPDMILPGSDKPVARLLRELDDPAKVIQVAVSW